MNEPQKLRFRKLDPSDKRRLHLPEGYWSAALANVPQPAQLTLRRYILNLPTMLTRPAGMLLTGDSGVGKSCAAAIVLQATRAAIQPVGYTGLFTTVANLRDALKRTLPFDESELFFDRARSVDMLVLDDLRAEDASDLYTLSPRVLEALVMERAARRRPTLVTTRMSYAQFSAEFESLAYSTQALLWPVELAGPSQRHMSEDVQSVMGTAPVRRPMEPPVQKSAPTGTRLIPGRPFK